MKFNLSILKGMYHTRFYNGVRNLVKAMFVGTLPYDHTPPYTHVVQIGDPVLRKKSELVDPSQIKRDKNIIKLINLMKTITINYDLSGLSACQIGIPLRIMTICCEDNVKLKYFPKDEIKKGDIQSLPLSVWINPEMKVENYDSNIDVEMCASMVSFQGEVKRYNSVSLTGLDENGILRKITAHGFHARIIQHEMDHMNGTLYTDVMNARTLKCFCWKEINEVNGMVELTYYPRAPSK